MENIKSVTFVGLDTMGLRCDKRDEKATSRLKESQVAVQNNKSLAFTRLKTIMILALTAFASSTTSIANSSVYYYQTRGRQYNEFLENNFDDSINQLNPLLQIYQTSLLSNNVYNLKEMM